MTMKDTSNEEFPANETIEVSEAKTNTVRKKHPTRTSSIDKEFWGNLLGPIKNNASLVEDQCLHKLRVDMNTTIVDLTTGEKKFWTEKMMNLVDAQFFDKYKNELIDPMKYPGVKPYCLIKTLINKADVVFHDPPYAEIEGGHTILNCNWENSLSRIRFNFVFGVVSIVFLEQNSHYLPVFANASCHLLRQNCISGL